MDNQKNNTTNNMIPLDQALAIIDKHLSTRQLKYQDCPVSQAHGHILAQKVDSRLDLPPFNKSAMDGYAVTANDRRDQYTVLENIPAGKTPTQPLKPGTASRVMTGAPVPENTARVIMFEHTDNGSEQVKVFKHSDKTNICMKGEDIHTGELIYQPGIKIGAIEMANMLACGNHTVKVYNRPKIAILTTGNEIVSDPAHLSPGQIIDSNAPLLAHLASENNIDVTYQKIISDDQADLTHAINQAIDQADIIILTGGVSAGDYDYTAMALQEVGFNIHFDRVAVQPGKPLTFATQPDSIAFGLPGNPVSVFIGFHLSILRAITNLTQGTPRSLKLQVPLKAPFKRRNGARTAFIPCKITPNGQAEPLPYHGSGHLLALSNADGFIMIDQGTSQIPAGGNVTYFQKNQAISL